MYKDQIWDRFDNHTKAKGIDFELTKLHLSQTNIHLIWWEKCWGHCYDKRVGKIEGEA